MTTTARYISGAALCLPGRLARGIPLAKGHMWFFGQSACFGHEGIKGKAWLAKAVRSFAG